MSSNVRVIHWQGSPERGSLRLLDQTQLPLRETYRTCHTDASVWEAIRTLQVRGAPAIGVAAAYGAWLGARNITVKRLRAFRAELGGVLAHLLTARPTAVNLAWALKRIRCAAERESVTDVAGARQAVFLEARAIAESDRSTCALIGIHAAPLIPDGACVLTHCNAGALATAGIGTALAGVYTAHQQGRRVRMYATETRPVLQGARLTAWELQRAGIDVTLICDNMVAALLARQRIDCVFVGADRIAANGDTANKIGTRMVATLARIHRVPFYVAAPMSTFDAHTADGDHIPIEERDAREITEPFGTRIAPARIKTWNPAFDVTPVSLITGFVTEYGLLTPPFTRSIARAQKQATDAATPQPAPPPGRTSRGR